MNHIYRNILQQRFDMTEWLIHFTRQSNGRTPQENLLAILSDAVLHPGWSIRNEGPTIYGPCAAVCFTEQPLIAFCQYLDARNDPTKVSGYGVLVHKNDVFAFGGKPVIYGLERVLLLEPRDQDYQPDRRIMSESCLPLHEQYRYVRFNLNHQPDPIDWSHEREWRWSAYMAEHLRIDGFPLFQCSLLRGCIFSLKEMTMCHGCKLGLRDYLQNKIILTKAIGLTI